MWMDGAQEFFEARNVPPSQKIAAPQYEGPPASVAEVEERCRAVLLVLRRDPVGARVVPSHLPAPSKLVDIGWLAKLVVAAEIPSQVFLCVRE